MVGNAERSFVTRGNHLPKPQKEKEKAIDAR
jgi:hypothetical protein